MHYLDDFHSLAPSSSSVCQHNLDRSIEFFSKLGISLHPDKQEGPLTCLTILAIELNSLNLKARLPQDKFDRITALLEEWSQKCWCKCKELESLIGHLQHACKVVLQGHSFCYALFIFLNLAWWQVFFQSWSGCRLHCPTSRFLQMPLGLLAMEPFSSVTGSQAHGFQHRSFSLSSTRNFSLSLWQPTSGVPYGPPNGPTSYQLTASG